MKEIIYDLEQLRIPAEPLTFLNETGIDDAEGKAIIADLQEIMQNRPDIIALSAPQIGINKRIFCIRFNDVIKTFINPIITKKQSNNISTETYLSLPGKEILIARPDEITTVYYNDKFTYEDNKLLGVAARIFDQQCQALDGVLPDELGLVSDPEVDGKLSDITDEEELKQVLDVYKQFIETKLKAISDSIAKDDEVVQKQYNMLKFTENVINGRAQILEPEGPKMNREQRRAAAKKNKGARK